MSDHATHQHHDGDNTGEIKSKTAFRSSFWVVLILVGLFIAALNFMSSMSHGGGHEAKEASSNSTLKGETGLGKERDEHEAAGHEATATGHDTAAHDTHGAEEAHH